MAVESGLESAMSHQTHRCKGCGDLLEVIKTEFTEHLLCNNDKCSIIIYPKK